MPRGVRSPAVPTGGLENMVYELGQRLGAALVRGVESSVGRAKGNGSASERNVAKRGPGRPRATASGAGCGVPHCDRRAVAKGLCATHYRKARRLDMGASLTASQLNELAEDGRKTRFGHSAA